MAGVGDPDYLGWVGRIAARSHRADHPVTAYSLGVRRQTSRDVLLRWRSECMQRLPAECDCRVVVSFGVNDTADEGGVVRVPVLAAATHLAQLLSQAASARWATLVIGPPPIAEPNRNRRTAELDHALALTCSSANVAYVSIFEQLLADAIWSDELARGDGAHPAAIGYQHMADLIWPHWLAWIAAPQRPAGHKGTDPRR